AGQLCSSSSRRDVRGRRDALVELRHGDGGGFGDGREDTRVQRVEVDAGAGVEHARCRSVSHGGPAGRRRRVGPRRRARRRARRCRGTGRTSATGTAVAGDVGTRWRPGLADDHSGAMTDAPAIADTPEPPYVAVIFTSIRADGDDGYGATAEEMGRLAAQQPGYLGFESARDGIGITVSYW